MVPANVWHGVKWVGLPASVADEAAFGSGRCIETALFRLVFALPETTAGTKQPEEVKQPVPLAISASGRYRLWVNGVCVTYGPCRAGRWEKHFETLDIAPWLRSGDNVLAVRVVAIPPHEAQRGNQLAPLSFYGNGAGPVLVVGGEVPGLSGSAPTPLATGVASWQVIRDASLQWDAGTATAWMGAMESVDLSMEPQDWKATVSSAAWLDAETRWKVAPNGYGEMLPFPLSERPIPLPVMTSGRFVREMPIRKSGDHAFSFGLPKADLSTDWVDSALAEADVGTGGFAVTGENREEPLSVVIPPHTHVVVELDAGFLTTAFFRLPMDGGAGSRVQITFAEAYTVAGEGKRPVKHVRDDAESGWVQGVTDTVTASGQAQVYEPFLFRTFRFVRVAVETAETALTLHTPDYVETGYPLELQSTFLTKQPWTARVWDMSARTLARCMQETYTDCPYYEQLQYTMDTRLQMLFTYASSGDDRLARKAIADFHASLLPEGMLQSRWPSDLPQVIPGFALHWIFMLEDHWQQTGSLELFRRYRPTVDAVLDWFERKTDENGLAVNLGHWEYADWVREWDDRAGVPAAVAQGPSTILNLTLAAALQTAAAMMRHTGRPDVAAEYEARHARIHTSVEQHCWSEEAGMYLEGPGYAAFSQHAQVWAVLSGLAQGERAHLVLTNALRKQGIAQCSFPWMYLLFRALEEADLYGETEALWDLWKDLIPQRLTTVPEIPFDTRSDCHAWGALPLYEFIRLGLGVRPAEPGWDRIRIEPRMLFLGKASGKAVTPNGQVDVAWECVDRKLALRCVLPEGTAAEVCLPDGTLHLVAADGARAQTFVCSC